MPHRYRRLKASRWFGLFLFGLTAVAATTGWGEAHAQGASAGEGDELLSDVLPERDRHDDYYYPALTSSEVYVSPAEILPGSDHVRRIGFVVGLTQQQFGRGYAPEVAIFAKGTYAEKLIIVALNESAIVTVYQARAMLAQMTALARATPIFIENRIEGSHNFLDLLKMLGFTQLTISNGQTYSHRIDIE